MASSVFISSEIILTMYCRISWGSAKYSTPSSWSSCPRIRWESRRIFSRESFTSRLSKDDPLFPGHLLLEHLEHFGVGDVRALHLRGVLDQDLADLLVEAVLHRHLLRDYLSEALHQPGRVVDLELVLRPHGLDHLAGDGLDFV